MLWFTSDTHFDHTRVIEYSNRPFQTIEEMNETLITNWNERITERDEVWHLGDFCWSDRAEFFRNQLKGRIHLILGNHDLRRTSIKDATKLFESVDFVKYLRYNHDKFWLSHYAHRTWPKSNRGSYHLYGHSHNDLPGLNRSMDVGVDAQNYRPISIDEVISQLKNKGFTNHHDD